MSNVQVLDETGKAILNSQIENCQRELTQMKEAYDVAVKNKANYVEQAELAKQVRELQASKFRKVPAHLVWEFEHDPKYWELQDKLLKFKHREEDHVDTQSVKRYDLSIEETSNGVKRNEEKLASLLAQLNEAK